jgi:hypothetical protein
MQGSFGGGKARGIVGDSGIQGKQGGRCAELVMRKDSTDVVLMSKDGGLFGDGETSPKPVELVAQVVRDRGRGGGTHDGV